MSSFQRVALFVLFDSLERDLVDTIRKIPSTADTMFLTKEEREKAATRMSRRESIVIDLEDDLSLLPGLDLGEKYQVLMRFKSMLDQSAADYFSSLRNPIERNIPTRNAVMHGRPLTTTEFALGFSLANDLVGNPAYWPYLSLTYEKYNRDPESFLRTAIPLLDEQPSGETLHNLPVPDYDDTGFLPRPELEKELKRKILGRYPVITVLGEGGNGKTALTLQTLYGLIASNDHSFDAIIWTSAKSTRLGIKEVERIEGAITDSLGLFTDIAQFEPGEESPVSRVQRLLGENRILLVIDNLETVLDDELRAFAAEIPGESKLVFTSRVPLGADLSVHVGDFSIAEARQYLRRLIDAYQISGLKNKSNDQLDRFARRLNHKPLLLKWFALGVSSGLDPERIVTNPELALKFCMENVIERLSAPAKTVASALAILPTSSSAPMLQEVTGLPALEIESGIAELLRFALVDRDEKHVGERQYQLGLSARSYILRVLSYDEDFSSNVLRKYRAVVSAYQLERNSQTKDRFDTKYYVMRNRSEALIAKRLKLVFQYMNRGELADADALINELRLLSPEYFEVHRVEAFLAVKIGDISRAAGCYETALELADGQAQLHLFYAAFLSRNMDDYDGAAKQLEIAMRLVPGTSAIITEAVRLAFYSYRFDRARELLLELSVMNLTGRDAFIRADLTTQLHCREADYLFRTNDFKGAEAAIKRLIEWLLKVDRRLFDYKHIEHLRKVHRLIYELQRSPQIADKGVLEVLQGLIRAVEIGEAMKS